MLFLGGGKEGDKGVGRRRVGGKGEKGVGREKGMVFWRGGGGERRVLGGFGQTGEAEEV